jgi:hypothetical protein
VDSLFSLVETLVPSVFTVAAVIVLVLVLKDADRPPVRVLAPAPRGGWRPLGGPGMPPVYWHARLAASTEVTGDDSAPSACRTGTRGS